MYTLVKIYFILTYFDDINVNLILTSKKLNHNQNKILGTLLGDGIYYIKVCLYFMHF
jgi:hypothetical protein